MSKEDKLNSITTIAGKRGIFWPSASIYGGQAGFYTYGHLGKLLKNRWETLWKEHFLNLHNNFYEIESSIILPEAVFKASGHLENFNDPLTECSSCHFRFRADQFIEDKTKKEAESLSTNEMTKIIKEEKLKCPKCGGQLEKVRLFNMMFPVELGVINAKKAYLTPETAQQPYLIFKSEFEATRNKLPLGLGVVGKAFRNEISPRQLFFRLREFTQAELQIFFDPETIDEDENWEKEKKKKLLLLPSKSRKSGKIKEISLEEARKTLKLPKMYLHYMLKVQEFFLDKMKLPKSKLRFKELIGDEKAFYNKYHWDIEADLETLGGFKEIGGVHYRTDHDLAGHQKQSKEKLEVFYNGKRFIPHVLELSFGVDRNIWTLLDTFYKKEKERTIFAFPPKIAPTQIAVFPLVNKDGLPKIAKKVYNDLRESFTASYDYSGSIGRMYRRQDEIGTKMTVTIDHQTKKDKTVTLRDRDSMKQIRIKITDMKNVVQKVLDGKELSKLGKIIK